jgi:holliday junction DNA helicase RuvA
LADGSTLLTTGWKAGMIAGIEGKLVKLDTEFCLVQIGSIRYEVMLPAYCVASLAGRIGTDISLCTLEYFEGAPGGSSMVPRLVGFLSESEREFFTKFISVKGIGVKRGLRSLCMPIASIASAIENGDEKILMTLPSVGKRMSQQIIAELKGKLSSFAIGGELAGTAEPKFKLFQAEALEILIAWGEKRNEAIELIELACKRHPGIESAEQLVPLVYRLKQGVEV